MLQFEEDFLLAMQGMLSGYGCAIPASGVIALLCNVRYLFMIPATDFHGIACCVAIRSSVYRIATIQTYSQINTKAIHIFKWNAGH